MSWQPLILLVLAFLFVAGLIISIATMLMLALLDAIAKAWRRLIRGIR